MAKVPLKQKIASKVDKDGVLFKAKTPEETCYKTKNEEEYEKQKREKKRRKIISFITLVLIVAAVWVVALLVEPIFGEGSAIANWVNIHILNRPYTDAISGDIYTANPLIQTIIIIVLGYIIITAIQVILHFFKNANNKRRNTILALLSSFIKYIGYAIVLGILLSTWGVDPTIIAAIFAALSIAIGFGAQGLISDLIAGLFIIFENSIRVGDYITWSGFRGEVIEVGIRTTRFRSPTGDVQIVNNSQLSSFVNMSMHRSVAICDILIEHNEDLDRVDKIIQDNFVAIAERIPAITEGPNYIGVAEITPNGQLLRIIAKCEEGNRPATVRALNREFKILFDKHKIKIAKPKVEVTNAK